MSIPHNPTKLAPLVSKIIADGGVIEVSLPIWFSNDFKPGGSSGKEGWVYLLSFFNKNPITGGDPNKNSGYSLLGGVGINGGSGMRPFLDIKFPDSGSSYSQQIARTPLLSETWHVIKIRVDSKTRKISYWLNGQLEAEGNIHPENYPIQLVQVHAGGYGKNVPSGAFIRNGEMTISVGRK